MIELACQTDFASKSIKVKELAYSIFNTLHGQENLAQGSFDDLKNMNLEEKTYLHINRKIQEVISITKENITVKVINIIRSKIVGSYIHHNKLMTSAIAINSNHSLMNAKLQSCVNGIAMHIIAMSPKFISIRNIDEKVKLEYLNIIKKQKFEMIKNKKPDIAEKIINGSLNKTLLELSLLDQKYIKNNAKLVKENILQYERSLQLTINIDVFFTIKK